MNAIFAQTNAGLKDLFVNNLTGDYLLAENSEKINSIFGFDMPLTSEYETISQLQFFLPFSEKLSAYSDVLTFTPIISAASRLEAADTMQYVSVFGIDSSTYFDVCKDIVIESGDIDLLNPGNNGIFINQSLVLSIEAQTGQPLVIGDSIRLTTLSSGTFRMQTAVFAGVYKYPATSEPFNTIILADPQLVRKLLRYTDAVAPSAEILESEIISFDQIDDLFSDFAEDFETSNSLSSSAVLENLDIRFAEAQDDITDYSKIVTWSFILVSAKDGIDKNDVYTVLRNDITTNTDTQIMDWSKSAGLTAQAPIALQTALTVGMIFIIIGAVLVIMNGLVLSVLERTSEIGTMRAIGASNMFIRLLYSTEMIILIIFFSIVGILLGIAVCLVLIAEPIIITNEFLVTLFGGTSLSPLITAQSFFIQLGLSLLIALFSCQYPVFLAIRIQPVKIMGKNI
ncbi:MAG: FtsX-like permease family protein [Spirochaetales bacterium]